MGDAAPCIFFTYRLASHPPHCPQSRAVVRIWDAFLWEGWKVIFRVAVATLKMHEKQFLAAK